MNAPDSSRPPTPLSPLASSLYHATSTIDDLTAALADFSRVPSPEPVFALTCCCGRDDCENLKAWLDRKSRLGSRLVLSAGEALHPTLGSVRVIERRRGRPGVASETCGICASDGGMLCVNNIF